MLDSKDITNTVHKLAGNVEVNCLVVPQDEELAKNQEQEIRCGDNGIFRGVPLTKEQKELVEIRNLIEEKYPSDGKYILDQKSKTLIICQSNAKIRARSVSKGPFSPPEEPQQRLRRSPLVLR